MIARILGVIALCLSLSGASLAQGWFPLAGEKFPGSEVQVLGTQIGVGLADTGTADSTNMLVSSQAFAGFEWFKSQITAVDNQTLAPDGTTTAATLTETTGNTTHQIYQGIPGAAAATQYTCGVSIKPGLRSRHTLVVQDSGAVAGVFIVFDDSGVQVGVAATTFGSGWSALTAAVPTSQSNGFVHSQITFTTPSSATFVDAVVTVEGDANTGVQAIHNVYTGSAASPAFSFYGVQCEPGTSLSAYGNTVNQGLAASNLTNGTLTQANYWGTQTANAWVGIDAGTAVQWTGYAFAPRPGSTSPYGLKNSGPLSQLNLDYEVLMQGNLVQTCTDSACSSPTTIDTVPATPYYPRFNTNRRSLTGSSRYVRMLPPSSNFGSIGQLQFFALASAAPANSAPVTPVVSPWGGAAPSGTQTVTITSRTLQASIYYTIDGSTPTTASTLYTGPFTLTVGASTVVKAIANWASLNTPASAIASATFYNYDFAPNSDVFDNNGVLVECHSGDVKFFNGLYYCVGTIANKYAPAIGGGNIIRSDVGVLMYSSPTGSAPWTYVGNILAQPSPWNSSLRPHIIYNALNQNYVMWTHCSTLPAAVVTNTACVAGTPVGTGPTNIDGHLGAWTWQSTNNACDGVGVKDMSLFVDSDGVTSYLVYVIGTQNGFRVSLLSNDYLTCSGTTVAITATAREAPVIVKNSSNTYFMLTSSSNFYNSDTLTMDVRYITTTAANPLSGWSAMPGTVAFASAPSGGTSYNCQPTFILTFQGHTQPIVGMDYWKSGSNFYGSRQCWAPITFPTGTTLQIQVPATVTISTLG